MKARAALLIVALVLAVVPALNAAGRIEKGRYYGPENDFSIANDSLYVPQYEVNQPGLTIVDFRFNPQQQQIGYAEVRAIEWVTVPSEVPQAQYTAVAQELIESYKTQRLPEHNFTVVNAKLEADRKRPHYDFVAHGRQKDKVFLWHGTVFFFGNRIALVSSVFAPMQPVEANQLTNAVPDKVFMSWARTIRPEGPAVAQNKP